MTHFMTYGDDWPPAPEKAAPKPPPRGGAKAAPLRLWQRCAATIVIFGLIWAAGAIALHIIMPGEAMPLNFPTPSQGHSTDVTTTLPPHPATTGSHP